MNHEVLNQKIVIILKRLVRILVKIIIKAVLTLAIILKVVVIKKVKTIVLLLLPHNLNLVKFKMIRIKA